MKNVLIIEDDITLELMLKTWLSKQGFEVKSALSISEAKNAIKDFNPDLVISDLRLPDDSGISFLKWMKERDPEVVFIMMTGYADIQTAVESIRSGAFDYIAKPLNPDELLKKIKLASSSKKEVQKKKEIHFNEDISEYIKGNSIEYQRVYEYADLVAPTRLSVLIRGESGVGKEHIARLIHEKSERAKGPFVPVDCGVISRELAASDFFGHIKGSFTGAINNKTGHFIEANGGTLFLDEIGNLSMETQMQLLRALQEKVIKPVGGTKEIPVDVRIIAATNEDMEHALSDGYFRTDLYHRINEFLIYVPTLSECKDDIEQFALHFLKLANRDINKHVTEFDPQTMNYLKAYSWPGNIRELKNIIYRMVLISQSSSLTPDLLPENVIGKPMVTLSTLSLKNNNEKDRIEEALKISNYNKSKAAVLLNVDRKTLYNKMKLYNIKG